MTKMVDFINKLSKVNVLIIGLVTVILLGFVDYMTTVEYSFAIFYLLPITFVTWYVGKKYGFVFAVISSLAWLNADMQLAGRYSIPTAPYWNALVRLGLFSVVVFLLSKLRKMEDSLEQNVKTKTEDLVKEIEERKKTELELKIKSQKLSELARRIQNIKEEENTKIAREIHDELGQSMTAIKIDLMWLSKRYSADPEIVESLRSITDTVDNAIRDVRQISSALRPKLLDELGFAPAVERYLKDFETRTSICYKLNYSENNLKFSLEESNALFRIFQEALTNVARHSKASLVEVDFSNHTGNIFNMKIGDNGVGLRGNYLSNNKTLGILGMKERAESIGGMLEISSGENCGTLISIKLPLTN